MKEKLKAALQKAGLDEELAEVISITSEEQIEGVIKQLKPTPEEQLDFQKVLGSQAFKDFVQRHGFDKVLEFSKTLQSEHDKKVTSGVQTFKEKFMKSLNPDEEGGAGGGQQPTPAPEDTPAWAKSLIEKVNAIEGKSQQATQLEQVKALMKESKLPDKLKEQWLGRVDTNSETSLEEQVKKLEHEHQEIHKSIVGEHAGSGLPSGNAPQEKVSDEEVASLVGDLGI